MTATEVISISQCTGAKHVSTTESVFERDCGSGNLRAESDRDVDLNLSKGVEVTGIGLSRS